MEKIIKAVDRTNKDVYIARTYNVNVGYKNYLNISHKRYYPDRNVLEFKWEEKEFDIVKPSQLEIAHLIACEEAGKYVEAPEIINTELNYDIF